MELNILNIPVDELTRLKKLVKYNRKKGVYLPSGINSFQLPNFWLLLFLIAYIIILFFIRNWDFYFYLIFFGTVLSYFSINQFLYYYYWNQLGKNSVFFDTHYFISIKNKFLQFIPLVEFKYSDIDLGNIRFHFNSKSILQPLGNINIEQALKFQSLLTEYSQNLKQISSNNDYPNKLNYTFLKKIEIKKYRLIFTSFITIILFLGLPYFIDNNSFQFAKNLNTATAYRTYLAESQNVRYRDEARNDISKIYDKYIAKYKNIVYSTSSGSKAFVATLKYLKSNNIYTVNLQFHSESLLNDIPHKNKKVIPISPSFTNKRNKAREKAVFQIIKNSFGNIFPADIFNISDNIKNNLIPKFEIYYTYKNRQDLYYNTKEEYIPDKNKTFYYGIKIDWWFRIFLPKNGNAIYEFKLTSTPAFSFRSESSATDAIYNNMVKSAFDDFKKEFFNHFLK